jgi:hypothetical protein
MKPLQPFLKKLFFNWLGGSGLLTSNFRLSSMVQAYNFLASWQLFPEKGVYEQGERPKSGIYKVEAVADKKELKIYQNRVSLESQAFASSYTIEADGDLNDFEDPAFAEKVQVNFPDGI